jgi:hypothetical protein
LHTGGPSLVDGEEAIAERVRDRVRPLLLRGAEPAGHQLDARAAVEPCAYLVVLHLALLSGKIVSLVAAAFL